ncbi:MAG: zinc ribbon domain-containing protein [Casimicrobiaceae bacterium]
MPIYEYRCSSCGARHEVLQKLSDPRLLTCPACHKDALVKQLSAAGFQLKGSGWYVTDFRNTGKAAAKSDAKDEAKADAKADAGSDSKTDAGTQAKPGSDAAKAPETKAKTESTPAAPPAPAAPKSSDSTE